MRERGKEERTLTKYSFISKDNLALFSFSSPLLEGVY
jgi:hypothetical protein